MQEQIVQREWRKSERESTKGGDVTRREEHYVGRTAMGRKGRRKRGRPKRIWLEKVNDDIREM